MSVVLATLLAQALLAEPSGRVGLFIGSNGAPPGRTPLEHAESDARNMRRVFVELGGLAAEDAYLLEAPSADAILDAVRRVAVGAKVLVFYYSGHADARALLLESSELSFTELDRALAAAGAELRLELVDACRSGAMTRNKGASLGERLHVDASEQNEGRVVITSSAEWEDSLESDQLGGSFFTLHLATGLRGNLEFEGYRVVVAGTAQEGLALARGEHPDLILLDLMLPDRDGVEVCRNLRRRGVKAKVLMLTALSSTDDKVQGLDSGSDDYLTKPFEFEELLARVRALLRRGDASESRYLKCDDLELDLYTRVAKRAGRAVELSNKEFMLLEYLMRNPNRVLSRTQIGEKIWDMNFEPSSNVVDVYIGSTALVRGSSSEQLRVDRRRMAGQAIALLALNHDFGAAYRVAGLAGERLGNAEVLDHVVRRRHALRHEAQRR